MDLEQLIRDVFAAFNARDVEKAFSFFANDLIVNNFVPKPVGLADFRALNIAQLAAFPDWQTTIEDLIAEGDKVVVRITQRGTHQGTFFGLAATGKQVSVTGVAIFRLRYGQIVEEWLITDQLGARQQLDAREG